MLSALAYGALVMLYIQLVQVLLRRPKRGRTFWFIVCFATVLFPLNTIAFAGRVRFAELTYVIHRDYPEGPKAFYLANSSLPSSVTSQISTTLIPWIADPLMFYRLMVLWNYQWWLLIFPGVLFVARVALSIPVFISVTRPDDPLVHTAAYTTAFYCLCLGLNAFTTTLICIRLYRMRHKAERVLGRLQASLYNSAITMFVESGAFFTIWSLLYVVTKTRGSWVQEVFLQPYSYVIALTRMLIILRMAQDRAWSKDIITAADNGVLDWQVSSTTGSFAPGDPDELQNRLEKLPKKFRDDSLSSESVR